MCSRHFVTLSTWVGPRPEGYIGQHDGEHDNNSLALLCWIPQNENTMLENLDPE